MNYLIAIWIVGKNYVIQNAMSIAIRRALHKATMSSGVREKIT
jgi:hypothetical protein